MGKKLKKIKKIIYLSKSLESLRNHNLLSVRFLHGTVNQIHQAGIGRHVFFPVKRNLSSKSILNGKCGTFQQPQSIPWSRGPHSRVSKTLRGGIETTFSVAFQQSTLLEFLHLKPLLIGLQLPSTISKSLQLSCNSASFIHCGHPLCLTIQEEIVMLQV